MYVGMYVGQLFPRPSRPRLPFSIDDNAKPGMLFQYSTRPHWSLIRAGQLLALSIIPSHLHSGTAFALALLVHRRQLSTTYLSATMHDGRRTGGKESFQNQGPRPESRVVGGRPSAPGTSHPVHVKPGYCLCIACCITPLVIS